MIRQQPIKLYEKMRIKVLIIVISSKMRHRKYENINVQQIIITTITILQALTLSYRPLLFAPSQPLRYYKFRVYLGCKTAFQ